MKNILYFLLSFTLLVTFISCSNDKSDPVVTTPVAASFSSATITRALDEVWQADDRIGIFAYQSNSIYDNYSNVPYVTAAGGAKASFLPSGSKSIYYPESGSLRFMAYSPYQSVGDDGLYAINVAVQSTPEKIDLIRSNQTTEYSSSNPEATLTFSHLLSNLIINIEPGDGLTSADLQDMTITVHNISTDGTYSLFDDTFAAESADKSANLRTVTNGTQYDAILIPDSYIALSIELVLQSGKSHIWDSAGIVLQSGKEHSYTITISEDKIEVSTATVSGWGSGDGTLSDTTTQTEKFDGDGTEATPYLISNKFQLRYLATTVNNGNSYSGCYFSLNQSIDLGCNATSQWTPIGTLDTPFSGNFDGNFNTISGIYIEATDGYQGLFGYIAGSEIRDLTIDGAVISTSSNVGALIGSTDESAVIMHCVNLATVEGYAYIGGLIGTARGDIVNCSNKGTIIANNTLAGIAGTSYGNLVNCYNEGAVTGEKYYVAGVVGNNQGLLTNCYNVGDINGSTLTGGVMGWGGIVYNCYMLEGCIKSGEGGYESTPMTNAEMISEDFRRTLDNNAYEYNNQYYTPDTPVCGWNYNLNSYPTLNYYNEPVLWE